MKLTMMQQVVITLLVILVKEAAGSECKLCSQTSKVCCNPSLGQLCPDGSKCCQCYTDSCECSGDFPPTPTAPPVRPPVTGDIIVIGLGAAGTPLVDSLSASLPDTHIIVIESGDVVTGRLNTPSHPNTQPTVFERDGTNYTASDIPGLYPSIAFNSKYEDVKQSQHPWTWLGKALGGNTMFNGMLWMEPDKDEFGSWGGPWSDGLCDEFTSLKSTLRVSQNPSPDGKYYDSGVGGLSLPLSGSAGKPFTAVAADGGRNGTNAYLERILTRPNVDIISGCSVDYITHSLKTVSFTCDRTPNNLATARDRIILSAGALGSAAILQNSDMSSVLGPVADHAGAAVEVQCPGIESFNFTDLSSASAEQFVKTGSGPFAQYGPVYVENHSGFEIFINPFGLSGESKSNTIGIYAMMMKPQVRGTLEFDPAGNTKYPNIYLRGSGNWSQLGQQDMMNMASNFSNFYATFLTSNPSCKPTVGPGSPLSPHLKPGSVTDMINYLGNDVSPGRPDAHISHLIMNHFTGTIPLGGSVDPTTLEVKGYPGIHVVDASIVPEPLDAHPVATVMAIGLKSADLIVKQYASNKK